MLHYSSRFARIERDKRSQQLASDGDPEVRDAAFQALGGIRRLLGERGLASLLTPIETDANKVAKVSFREIFLPFTETDLDQRIL